MARYLVERTFSDGLNIPVNGEGEKVCLGVVDRNAELGVTWVHSYVSEDRDQDLLRLRRPRPRSDPPGGVGQRSGRSMPSPGSPSSTPTSTSRARDDGARTDPKLHRSGVDRTKLS